MDKILSDFTGFEWDRGNRHKNRVKHGVSCREAEEVFLNERVMLQDPGHSTEEEKRFIFWGETNAGRRLSVVFTIRSGRVRIISARPMHHKERVIYDTEKEKGIY